MAALETLANRSPVPVELDAELDERLPMPVETTAYFVVAEALTNVGKYSLASHANVAVRLDGDRLEVEVRDDGIGGATRPRGRACAAWPTASAPCTGASRSAARPGAARACTPGSG